MSKVMSMKAVRAQDIVDFLNSLSPQEVADIRKEDTLKGIRFMTKLMDEISDSNKAFTDIIDKVKAPGDKIRLDGIEAINKIREGEGSDEEKKKAIDQKVDRINAEINLELEKQSKALGVEAVSEVVVNVTIGSDERFNFLKEVLEKKGPSKFNKIKALAEVSEALEEAKEA